MKIDLARFHETFLEEAGEHARELEACLLELERHPSDPELVARLFRAAHSLKGASATFGFADLARFTHALESLLDEVREGRVEITGDESTLLLRAVDVVKALIAAIGSNAPPPAALEQVLSELQRPMSTRADTAPPARCAAVADHARRFVIRFVPGPDLLLHGGMDPLLVLRELDELGTLEVEALGLEALPSFEQLEPERLGLGWQLTLTTDAPEAEIRDVFAFVADESELSVQEVQPPRARQASATGSAVAATESSSLRVPTEKVDRIIDLVGELVIAQSMILQALNAPSTDTLSRVQEAAQEMERNTRELQERVMGIRMVPVGHIFGRFPRLVRDISATLGKQIILELHGEDTELDKSVAERLTDPLTHLVRNAIDHGIEPVQTRRAAGKPEAGTLRMSAFHQGGNVVLEISDDGSGLDLDRIRQKALTQGLLTETDTPSDEELTALIFHPGFSTAETVSDLSGRGVGMDVVRRCIESLNGTLAVHSVRGQGTRLRLTLPLTLAILDGMALRTGEQVFVLPIHAIIETFRPRRDQLRTVLGAGEVVRVRGEPLPLVHLHRVFALPGEPPDPLHALVVIVESGASRFGLVIDELLAQSQVVIKSLETHYRRVEGAMGATILGDGTVALLLDVPAIARIARVEGRVAGAAERPMSPAPVARA